MFAADRFPSTTSAPPVRRELVPLRYSCVSPTAEPDPHSMSPLLSIRNRDWVSPVVRTDRTFPDATCTDRGSVEEEPPMLSCCPAASFRLPANVDDELGISTQPPDA